MADETALEKLQNLIDEIDPEVLSMVMPLTGGTITMMFTDIVDSTKKRPKWVINFFSTKSSKRTTF